MSGSTRWLAAILGGIAVVVLVVGAIILHREQVPQAPEPAGRWPEKERAAFIDSCVKTCRAAPGVTPDRYPLCDQACKCGADEGEKIVSGEELVEIYRALQSGKPTKEQNEKLEKMKAAGIACTAQGPK
jgi:hypothetical protein